MRSRWDMRKTTSATTLSGSSTRARIGAAGGSNRPPVVRRNAEAVVALTDRLKDVVEARPVTFHAIGKPVAPGVLSRHFEPRTRQSNRRKGQPRRAAGCDPPRKEKPIQEDQRALTQSSSRYRASSALPALPSAAASARQSLEKTWPKTVSERSRATFASHCLSWRKTSWWNVSPRWSARKAFRQK